MLVAGLAGLATRDDPPINGEYDVVLAADFPKSFLNGEQPLTPVLGEQGLDHYVKQCRFGGTPDADLVVEFGVDSPAAKELQLLVAVLVDSGLSVDAETRIGTIVNFVSIGIPPGESLHEVSVSELPRFEEISPPIMACGIQLAATYDDILPMERPFIEVVSVDG